MLVNSRRHPESFSLFPSVFFNKSKVKILSLFKELERAPFSIKLLLCVGGRFRLGDKKLIKVGTFGSDTLVLCSGSGTFIGKAPIRLQIY
jgi:hypothetical protein